MRLKILFIGSLLFFCLPLFCFAVTTTNKMVNDDNRIKVDLCLYFWPAGMNSEFKTGGNTTNSNIKFRDILRDLKMGVMGTIRVSKNDWFAFNDAMYLDVEPNVSETLPSGAQLDATLDTKILMDMIAVGHKWKTSFDWNLFAGARYFYGRIKLDATAGSGTASQEAHVTKANNWFTPTIGGEINLPITNQLSFDVIAAIGASAKSSNWEAIPMFLWKFNDTCTAAAGYRLLDIKYREEGFKFDTLVQGPIIGVKITF